MRRWLFAAAAATVLALAVGCSTVGTAEEPEPSPELSAESPAFGDGETAGEETAIGGTLTAPATEEIPASETAEKPEDKNVLSVASPQTETIDPGLPESPAPGGGEPSVAPAEIDWEKYNSAAEFDPLRPSLMGLEIGTDAAAVKSRFGEPTAQASVPDEAVEASVMTYPGFTIGIRDAKVLFVEVSTSSVNPGLNGLRLGDTLSDAVAKLGTPTGESEFVIRYVANGSILKLDLNPDTQVIHSIKLFPEE